MWTYVVALQTVHCSGEVNDAIKHTIMDALSLGDS
jgi:hypothetical protein